MEGEQKPTNLIIATVLIFVILILWQTFFLKPSTSKTSLPTKPDTVQTKIETTPVKSGEKDTSKLSKLDTLFVVNTPLYEVVFSKSGGILSYKVKKIGKFESIDLLNEGNVLWADAEQIYTIKDTLKYYEVGDSPLSLTLLSTFDSTRKILTFYPDKYLINVKYEGLSSVSGFCKGNLKLTEKNQKQEAAFNSYIIRAKTTVKINISRLKDLKTFDLGIVSWFGIRTKYFFTGILNLKKPGVLHISKDSLNFAINSNEYSIYFGPLDYILLKSHHKELASAFDFGSWIIKPFAYAIYYIMKGLHTFIPNYGIVIIIFALLMKFAFFPLSRKQVIAAKRMQELKPKLDTLQKLYANDPQKLQKEMMELYKKYNVNPFSGCLTLLIQLPIFFALYQILNSSISLKGAHFILWIKDLSDKDPYYILPILMGVTSIILSMLQQTATDTQSKMLMYMMPIIMIFIFASLPSGIVLYWFTFNVFGIFEALLIKRLEGRHGT
jgi:YidC/Oxa1 family membrane protein insertase